jgi:hypothetical protein
VGSSEEKSEGLRLGGGTCTISGPGPGEFDWTTSDKFAENQWNADICGIIWFSGIISVPVRARAPGRILIGEYTKVLAPATPRVSRKSRVLLFRKCTEPRKHQTFLKRRVRGGNFIISLPQQPQAAITQHNLPSAVSPNFFVFLENWFDFFCSPKICNLLLPTVVTVMKYLLRT